jgi:hypothetical protein
MAHLHPIARRCLFALPAAPSAATALGLSTTTFMSTCLAKSPASSLEIRMFVIPAETKASASAKHCARHADRPRADLAARQSRTLVVFVMRTQPGRAGAEEARHLGQIAFHGIEIEEQRGRIDFAQSHQL